MRVIIIFTEIYILGMSFQTCQPQITVLSTWASLHIYLYNVHFLAALLSHEYIMFLLFGYFPSPAPMLWDIATQWHIIFSECTYRWVALAHFGFVRAYVLQSIFVLRAPLFVHAMTSMHPRFRRCRHHPQGCQYSKTAWQSCRCRHPPPNHRGWCRRPSSLSYGSWEKEMNIFICKL